LRIHPYDYNVQVPWSSSQNQYHEKTALAAYRGQQQSPLPTERVQSQRVGAMERLPKDCVLALAQELKRWLVIASLVGFDTFCSLVAVQQVEAEAIQTTQLSADSSQSSLFERDDFFNQQGGDNFGSRNTAPAPITGSGVS